MVKTKFLMLMFNLRRGGGGIVAQEKGNDADALRPVAHCGKAAEVRSCITMLKDASAHPSGLWG